MFIALKKKPVALCRSADSYGVESYKHLAPLERKQFVFAPEEQNVYSFEEETSRAL